jgi:hypothetical protein
MVTCCIMPSIITGIAARLANMPRGANQHDKASANLHTDAGPQLSLSEQALPRPPMTSTADAARMLNVSPRSVADARKVHEYAPPEISQAVDEGRMSVSLAAQVADLPDEAKANMPRGRNWDNSANLPIYNEPQLSLSEQAGPRGWRICRGAQTGLRIGLQICRPTTSRSFRFLSKPRRARR